MKKTYDIYADEKIAEIVKKLITSNSIKLKSCPFCKKSPTVGIPGKIVDICCGSCGVSMIYVKADCLTSDEIKTYDTKIYMYNLKAETKALAKITDLWNTRK